TEALHSDRARFLVELTQKKDVKLRDICRCRDEIARIVAVEEPAHRGIGFRSLMQSLSHAPDDAADGLTPSGLGIDDPAAIIGTDKAVQSHEAEVRIDVYFSEHCGEAEGGLRSLRGRSVVSIA